MDLGGKVAIVTGASRGIGRAIALRMAGAGAKIVLGYQSKAEAAQAVQRQIAQAGGDACLVQGSVADPAVADRLVTDAIERFGRLDILVNNAGILSRQFMMMTKIESWQTSMDVNLTGAFLCARAALKVFVEQRGGCIINVSSVAGLRGLPGQVGYAASKAGLLGMTRTLAREVGRYGVRVNAIAPGYIATDMLSEKETTEAANQVPLGTIGDPDDVAHMSVFLATDRARYITGQTMIVDGGLSI